MRTRVIPAQITTVEDRIAGSLNLNQLFLLMIPVFWATIEFVILPPKLHVTLLKVVIALLIAGVCGILALRIKGKVIINWLIILLRYNLRPRWYVLNKNDAYLREMHLPVFEKRQSRLFRKKKAVAKDEKSLQQIVLSDIIRLEQLITNPDFTFSVKTNKKGGLNVGIEQIK